MSLSQIAAEIIFNQLPGTAGDIGEIILNRPQALNALTPTMCAELHRQLKQWQNNSAIKAVIIRGAGDRAFCAGGDIRTIYNNGPKRSQESAEFFATEYQMNTAIYHFNKPYIALLDGITMGGGVGVSLHGSHRIGTARLMFAMPETGIGFFPDVGGGYFLPRLPYYCGFYLGLTGARIGISDALKLGLVQYTMHPEQEGELITALCEAKPAATFKWVDQVLAQFNDETSEMSATVFSEQKNIAHCFSQTSIEKIIFELEKLANEWGQQTIEILSKKSPTSLKVTLEQLIRGASLEFDAVMAMEYQMAGHFLKQHDFYEGVRAAIIDKDQQPRWQPAHLAEVSQQDVENFFNDL